MNASPTSTQPESPQSPAKFSLWRGVGDHLGWVLSLFLIGVGAKLWLIRRSGTSLPFWDAWDAEAAYTYIPWFEGRLTLADLFHPLNEHRPFFTRLFGLALVLLNGQWDNRLQMVANAFIHSATLAAFGWAMARLAGRRVWPFVWPALVMALALPFGWENTLGGGIYTQFYFLLIFSLSAIWLTSLNEPLSARWCLGMLFAAAALFTTASGFLVAGAVAGLAILDILKKRPLWGKHVPTFVICGLIGIAGMLLKVEVPHHKLLQAHSPMEFLISLGNNLAWPWIVVPPYALVNLFPIAMLCWMYLTTREQGLAAERVILCVGGWVFLQCMAAAYARGAGGGHPFWRYMDTSSFIIIIGAYCLALLLTRYRERLWFGARRLGAWRVAAIAWALFCATGLWLLNSRALSLDIPEREFYQRMQLRTTRDFLATDDVGVIRRVPGPYRLRPDDAQIEADLLRNTNMARILPAIVRKPLRVLPEENATHGFTPNGCMPPVKRQPAGPWWGSCAADGKPGSGVFESAPVQASSLPFLEFPVAGFLGQPGLSMTVEPLQPGGAKTVHPRNVPVDDWGQAVARAPGGAFKVTAVNQSEGKWLAFKEPRELGRLSWWSMRLEDAWKWFVIAGILCLALCPAAVRDKLWRGPAPRAA